MSIGLPGHLVPQVMNRAYSRSAHAIALVCLLAAFGIVSAVQVDRPLLILWPAMLALVPMGLLLFQLDRHRTSFYTVAYIVIGGASIYWYSLAVMSQYPLKGTHAFVLTLVKLALIFVGAPGIGVVSAIAACVAGFVVAEVTIVAAALQTGVAIVPDLTTLTILAILVVTLVVAAAARHSVAGVQPSIYRAARDEQLASVRYRIEAKAAAVMHDTVLNHLAAIATSEEGAISAAIRAEVERDLEFLIGEEWLADRSTTIDSQARSDWQNSEVLVAVEETRRLGLEIEVSGDLAAVGRLGGEPSVAVGQAVKQCLINVLRHSGTNRAEVVVYGSQTHVSVMVIDNGRGFSEEETGPDRLGIRNSVRRRIENVDGDVQLWSTIGRGTSVMISVPASQSVTEDDSARATP